MNLRFWSRGRQERELEEEIRFHLQLATEKHLEAGSSPAEARSAARREFGNADLVKEATRDVWGLGWVEQLSQDLHYGARILWKSPIYAFVSILTLALGIGASTSIFSVVYGVLLRPLPYPKPEQIVSLWEVSSEGNRMRFADPNFEDVRAQARSLQGVAQMAAYEATVLINGEPERVRVAAVSRDFFSVMGVHPVRGRLFAAEEQRIGAAPAALVSYSYWQGHLHAARDLGAVKLTVSTHPTAVIGVLPPGFKLPDDSQLWVSRETDARLPSRTAHNWRVVARMKDGASLEQARADVSAIGRRLGQQYRSDIDLVDVAVVPLKDALTADFKPALLVLLGVSGLLLLVACANVMSLSLAQASARAGELAVRAALGASRWRLVRQFLAEALLLCLLGGCLGVISAYFGVRVLLALAPGNIPRLDEVSVNLPVLGFTLGLALAVAIGLGVLTALRATAGDVQSPLAESGMRQGTALGGRRAGRIIVAGQIAITFTLLIGAGLLGRSMLRVLSVHPGFETENTAALDLKLPELEAGMEVRRVQLLDQLISRLEALPGVQTVGGTHALPLQSDTADGTFAIVDPQQLLPAQRELIERSARVSDANTDPAFMKEAIQFLGELFRDEARTGHADYVVASEGYFQTLGIPLRDGRWFNDSDGPDAPHVAVISESVARQEWSGQNPLGRTIEFGNMDGDLRLLTIVGVVGDVRAHNLEVAPSPTIYMNYRQRPRSTSQFNIVVRTSSDPAAVFAAARGILRQLDPTLPVRFHTLDEIFSRSLNNRRFNLLLVGVFALAALVLAMAGVFGVLAYSVAQRTREIGVRLALGATDRNILRMVLGQGLITAAVGTALGLAGSFLLTHSLRSLLFEVSPNDPATVVDVALLLLLAAMLASYVPARRAARVDPGVALRSE
ncbi:MAG TPA: ABC transporter permease [Thermoanaerobaculia bacterium]|jgi:cell division protein FtsX|nr:ABC transporter permease [Thermoanaerobaculia bacterium]